MKEPEKRREFHLTFRVLTSHSALTDFLASQNISANRIREDAEARRNAANASNAQSAGAGPSSTAANGDAAQVAEAEEAAQVATAADKAAEKKRKSQAAAIDKIKKSKAFKKRKRQDEDSDSDGIAEAILAGRAAPLPGQMENCEICDKRFTVTPYSRAGPNGGLLCNKCGKELAQDNKDEKAQKKKKVAARGTARRQVASNRLDGVIGCKSLMTMCISTLVNNIDLADDLGDLPDQIVDRVARQVAKRRILTPMSLNLFLQSGYENVTVYDSARLGSDDLIRIFQMVPKLKNLKLKNAIQFKDEVMNYLITRKTPLNSLYLHGANLVSEEAWKQFLVAKGKQLASLRVYFTDKHVGDNFTATLKETCPALKRLKIAHNQQVTDVGIGHISELHELEHLSIQLITPTSTEPYVKVINKIGKTLQTLSLTGESIADLDDRVLDAIHENCTSLRKLRITHSEVMTDAGFVRLFKNWVNKPLTFIDFEKCRHVDSSKPRENAHLNGLCSDGFRALMSHSGKSLKKLNVHACRHISREAFEDVFSLDKEYPELENMEISFCEEVTDFVVGCIFRTCPKLKNLNVFGCMKLKEVRVPKGRILVGMPNAMGMEIEGTED
ncbi:nucleotide exsicion repair RAD7 [Apiospora saccharicola]|uniref:Nucleotide exsicion repair RAD7 n=1 Tax=Apiospora saccharicola TaxID=335842 RepID=A0ABR1TQ21_9PEZI